MREPTTLVPEFSSPALNFFGAGMTHAGNVRAVNEDSILTDPTGVFWAIADGMGGYGHGETASEVVIDHLSQMPDTGDAGPQIEALLQAANAEIQHRLLALGADRMGATVVALRLDDNAAHLAWAGDCRAYLCRAGVIKQVTQDHTVVAELVRDGLLTPENAVGHASANVVTRAVGAEPELEVDHREEPLKAGDRLVLCSDGLTACLGDAHILELVEQASDPDTASRHLVARCLEEGAPDNVSVIVIFAKGP